MEQKESAPKFDPGGGVEVDPTAALLIARPSTSCRGRSARTTSTPASLRYWETLSDRYGPLRDCDRNRLLRPQRTLPDRCQLDAAKRPFKRPDADQPRQFGRPGNTDRLDRLCPRVCGTDGSGLATPSYRRQKPNKYDTRQRCQRSMVLSHCPPTSMSEPQWSRAVIEAQWAKKWRPMKALASDGLHSENAERLSRPLRVGSPC